MCAWERIFKERGIFFTKIHAYLPELIPLFRRKGVKRILDLGCGSGRHVVYLAERGFEVYGFDISPTAIKLARNRVKKENLKTRLQLGDMNKKFAYTDNFFDVVLSIQTMHHNSAKKLKKTVEEIERVLVDKGIIVIITPKKVFRKKGRYFIPSSKGIFAGNKFRKLEDRVFIPIDGPEKGLPHFYFNKKLIKKFFSNFDIDNIYLDKHSHYCFIGVKNLSCVKRK
jgi:SAM-dependent methyltransferase